MGLVAEPKLNSFRCIAEKLGDRFRIKTEGGKDRTKEFASLTEVLAKIPDDYILDGGVGIEKNGKPLPRIKLMTLMADKPELTEGEIIVCTVFDLPFWKKDLHLLPFSERRKKLEEFYNKYLKSSKNFKITETQVVNNKSELEKAFKKFAKYPQSEGIVVKDIESIWDVDGSIEGWAKLKIEAEIKVMVIEKHSVKGGNYNYTCGVLKGDSPYQNITRVGDMELVNLGKTFNTKINASPGDILTIGIEEIIPSENKLDWLGPRVIDKDEARKEPYYANQVVQIAEKANILQKAIGSGRGIYLQEPHGKYMFDGDKNLVIKIKKLPDEYVEKTVFLCSGDLCYGEVKFHKPIKITQKEFQDLKEKHKITDKEAKDWGFDKEKSLWSYEFDWVDKYKLPKEYEYPQGVQTVIRNVKFKKVKDEEGAASVEGNIDFEEGDSGDAVAQLHIMGIEEKELESLLDIKDRAIVARGDLRNLEKLLKNKIGEQGAHIDIRFHRKKDKYWEGGEIMIGNLSGLNKIYGYKKGQSLRFGWKVPRKGETKIDIIRGPMSWFKAGVNKLEIFEPGEVGATANMYAAMLRIDKFNWSLYQADEHAKKFHVTNSRHFDGNWLMAYVPTEEGKRIWMMRKLDDDDHKKEVDKQERINSPTKAVYGVVPSKPLSGRTDSPKKNWKGLMVDKHIKDAWLEGLNSLAHVEIRSTDEGKDKDRVAFVVFRMRDQNLDSLAEKVSEEIDKSEGLFSISDIGTENRPRIVVAGKTSYGEKNWEEWWSSLAEKIKKALERIIKKDDSPYFRFLKVNKKEYIVGGIVYSANDVDTQGDAASASEIWKALKKFMIKGGKIKLMHEGKPIKAKIIECYQAEEDHHKGGTGDNHLVKSGDWYISVYLGDEKEIWNDIIEGKFNGFSMGGTATTG